MRFIRWPLGNGTVVVAAWGARYRLYYSDPDPTSTILPGFRVVRVWYDAASRDLTHFLCLLAMGRRPEGVPSTVTPTAGTPIMVYCT